MLIFKSLLYASSYIPIFILIFLNNLESFKLQHIKEMVCSHKTFWTIIIAISVITIVTFITFLIKLRIKSKSNNESMTLKDLDVKANDGETLSYFITYLVPLLTLDLNNNPSIVMNLLLVIIVGLYFVRNNYLHFNILLLVIGYRIFTDEKERIYLTKNDLFTIKVKELKAFQYNNTSIYYIPPYKKY